MGTQEDIFTYVFYCHEHFSHQNQHHNHTKQNLSYLRKRCYLYRFHDPNVECQMTVNQKLVQSKCMSSPVTLQKQNGAVGRATHVLMMSYGMYDIITPPSWKPHMETAIFKPRWWYPYEQNQDGDLHKDKTKMAVLIRMKPKMATSIRTKTKLVTSIRAKNNMAAIIRTEPKWPPP